MATTIVKTRSESEKTENEELEARIVANLGKMEKVGTLDRVAETASEETSQGQEGKAAVAPVSSDDKVPASSSGSKLMQSLTIPGRVSQDQRPHTKSSLDKGGSSDGQKPQGKHGASPMAGDQSPQKGHPRGDQGAQTWIAKGTQKKERLTGGGSSDPELDRMQAKFLATTKPSLKLADRTSDCDTSSDSDSMGSRWESKFVNSKSLKDALVEACRNRGIGYRVYWGNELEARMHRGEPITPYAIDLFLTGITMERAHSVTEGFDKTVSSLAEQVSKLMKVTKDIESSDKKLQSTVKRFDDTQRESLHKSEALLDSHKEALIDCLASQVKKHPDVGAQASSREIRAPEKKSGVPEKNKVETPGADAPISELDDVSLAILLLKKLDFKVKEEEEEVLGRIVTDALGREDIIECLVAELEQRQISILKGSIKKAVANFTNKQASGKAPVGQEKPKVIETVKRTKRVAKSYY